MPAPYLADAFLLHELLHVAARPVEHLDGQHGHALQPQFARAEGVARVAVALCAVQQHHRAGGVSGHQHYLQLSAAEVEHLAVFHVAHGAVVVLGALLDEHAVVAVHPHFIEVAYAACMVGVGVGDDDVVGLGGDALHNLVQVGAAGARVYQRGTVVALQEVHGGVVPGFKDPGFVF